MRRSNPGESRRPYLWIICRPRITKGLNNIAKLSGQPARKIALKAVEQYIEDLFDAIEAKRILARGEKTIPWEEVQRRCGLLEG